MTRAGRGRLPVPFAALAALALALLFSPVQAEEPDTPPRQSNTPTDTTGTAQVVVRGPYLQSGTSSSVIVK